MEDQSLTVRLMFDPGHTLAERVLAEQFRWWSGGSRSKPQWTLGKNMRRKFKTAVFRCFPASFRVSGSNGVAGIRCVSEAIIPRISSKYYYKYYFVDYRTWMNREGMRGCIVKHGDKEVAIPGIEFLRSGDIFQLTPASKADVECNTEWHRATFDGRLCDPNDPFGNAIVEAEPIAASGSR
jgi:hypothetical protein